MRLRSWLSEGPDITLRQFLFYYMLLFLFNTVILISVMYLVRQNHDRINDIKAALIKSCRNGNQIRAEGRLVIQELKDNPAPDLGIGQLFRRYDVLTRAQANLADKRCE